MWIAFLILPVIPAFLGTVNYLNNIEILDDFWYSLWTQNTLFTSYFFLPILISMYCSYLMWVEKNNQNLRKMLSLPVSKKLFFLTKILSAGKMAALSEFWIGVLYLISGKLIGMKGEPPIRELFIWCLFGTLGGLVMVSLQLIFSLLIDSFSLSIGIGFVGGLSGMFALAKKFGHIYPYSLMAYGMASNNTQQQLTAEAYPQFILICLTYLILFTFAGAVLMEKKEI